jgi:hypothetical protein
MIGFIGLFDTALDYNLELTITHTLVSTVKSTLPLLGSGFKRIPLRSRTISVLSYQLLTAIAHNGPRRKHRSSVAVQLLLNDGMTYSIVACAAISTVTAENTIPLLLFTGRCCFGSTNFALSKYATIFSA